MFWLQKYLGITRKLLSAASLLSLFHTPTPSLSLSFQHYSSSHSVTVHMVLQHCWSPVATLPTMHLWLWAFDEADRLRVLRYRPAIAQCEVSSVQRWSVSERHTPLTFSLSWTLPINPQFSALTFASIEVCPRVVFRSSQHISPFAVCCRVFCSPNYHEIDPFLLISCSHTN